MSRPRVLFIQSADFGDLSTAFDLMRGGTFTARALLPRRLFNLQPQPIDLDLKAYDRCDDLRTAIRELAPDLVFLFSGWLFAINGLMTAEELKSLVDELKADGLAVLTSDPFLGLADDPSLDLFNPAHPGAAFLAEHFRTISGALRGVDTYSPVPLHDPSADSTAYACFPGLRTGADSTREWMFLLSHEDVLLQTQKLGEVAFAGRVVALALDARRAGAEPVLLAPERFAELVRALAPQALDLIIAGAIGHDAFQRRLAGAEYSFHWNIVSNSILTRALAAKPVFFLGEGHLVHAMPSIREKAIAAYYAGARPPMLDDNAPLERIALARLSDRQRDDFEPARARIASLPSPDEMVWRILEAHQMKRRSRSS